MYKLILGLMLLSIMMLANFSVNQNQMLEQDSLYTPDELQFGFEWFWSKWGSTDPKKSDNRTDNGTRPDGNRTDNETRTDGNRNDNGTRPDGNRTDNGTKPDGNRTDNGTRPDGNRTDNGTRPDGNRNDNGTRPDGNRTDNGTKPYGNRTDNGTRPDGNRTDNGTRTDGNRTDNGTRPDGNQTDNGTKPDGNRTDNGTRPDGNRTDNGTRPDGNRTDNGTRSDGNRTDNGTKPDGNRTDNGTRPDGNRTDQPSPIPKNLCTSEGIDAYISGICKPSCDGLKLFVQKKDESDKWKVMSYSSKTACTNAAYMYVPCVDYQDKCQPNPDYKPDQPSPNPKNLCTSEGIDAYISVICTPPCDGLKLFVQKKDESNDWKVMSYSSKTACTNAAYMYVPCVNYQEKCQPSPNPTNLCTSEGIDAYSGKCTPPCDGLKLFVQKKDESNDWKVMSYSSKTACTNAAYMYVPCVDYQDKC